MRINFRDAGLRAYNDYRDPQIGVPVRQDKIRCWYQGFLNVNLDEEHEVDCYGRIDKVLVTKSITVPGCITPLVTLEVIE